MHGSAACAAQQFCGASLCRYLLQLKLDKRTCVPRRYANESIDNNHVFRNSNLSLALIRERATRRISHTERSLAPRFSFPRGGTKLKTRAFSSTYAGRPAVAAQFCWLRCDLLLLKCDIATLPAYWGYENNLAGASAPGCLRIFKPLAFE
jgi:hypothetical protein